LIGTDHLTGGENSCLLICLSMAKKTFPEFVPPMLASSAKSPFDSPDWIFEIKWDGYRAIAVFDAAGKPHLWSRNALLLEQKFPATAKAVSELKLRLTILDGEIVALDENGISHFQLLQRFQKQPTAPTIYCAFDLLWHDGSNITAKPLLKRRELLEKVISEKALKDAMDRMRPFFTDRSPFDNPPKVKEKVQWLQPKLVCEVAFAEMTADEQLRQATFLGWRDDKKPEHVVLEIATKQSPANEATIDDQVDARAK
jgi:ATP-dependent DNA ligase